MMSALLLSTGSIVMSPEITDATSGRPALASMTAVMAAIRRSQSLARAPPPISANSTPGAHAGLASAGWTRPCRTTAPVHR